MWAARSLIALLSPGFGFHLSPLAPYGSLRIWCCGGGALMGASGPKARIVMTPSPGVEQL